ncbi:unnamed protein product [Phaedon cochleariae]|uniref:Transcription termination factor 3, mitochondrial n=1 Tax=Phaedon cochleariae TaxID=80249 RepID=A0A9P0GSY7_PHACE|nr:unnamed protein product [Phaedon cochleariae]
MLKIISKLRISNTTFLRNFASFIEDGVTESHSSISSTSNGIRIMNNTSEETSLTERVKAPKKIELSEVSKYLRPGALSSMYINHSDTLQQLLKLGVKFYEIEKDPNAFKFILTLKFEEIMGHILFLKDIGIEPDTIGKIITKNPFLLREELNDLEVRINYLQYKKFTNEMVVRIIGNNAYWLTHSTQEIDERLGFFQHNFGLRGNQVRALATKCPKLITYSLDVVKEHIFMLKEEMGLTPVEIRKVILDKPKLLMCNRDKILKTFEYFHNIMKIPLERIIKEPYILTFRQSRLMERHLFLVKLDMAQYDPKKPNYVGLSTLVSGTDAYFSTEVAKSSVHLYNIFLKSL